MLINRRQLVNRLFSCALGGLISLIALTAGIFALEFVVRTLAAIGWRLR